MIHRPLRSTIFTIVRRRFLIVAVFDARSDISMLRDRRRGDASSFCAAASTRILSELCTIFRVLNLHAVVFFFLLPMLLFIIVILIRARLSPLEIIRGMLRPGSCTSITTIRLPRLLFEFDFIIINTTTLRIRLRNPVRNS